jgi:hypothetical protein
VKAWHSVLHLNLVGFFPELHVYELHVCVFSQAPPSVNSDFVGIAVITFLPGKSHMPMAPVLNTQCLYE